MREFWARLSDREKLFVGIGGAVVAVIALLQLILAPAINWRADMVQRRESAQDLYRLVSEASASAGVAAAAAGVDLNTPILNVLTQTTAEFAIVVNYRNARADGAVEANVAAPAEKLFEWLHALESRYGVTVATADVARSATGTEAQAQLTLVRRTAQ
jgi:type II secretory pathway component PulM